MSFDIEIVSEPKITHTSGDASRWLMSQNPLIFKFQRKDLTILSITDLGTSQRLTFLSSPHWISVGDSVYYGNSIQNNDGEYLVTVVNAALNYIEIATSLTLGPLGFVNDTTNLQNYHVALNIYKWIGVGSIGDTIANAKYYDDPTGLITADLREYLEPLLDISFPSFFGVATKHEKRDHDFSFTFAAGFVQNVFPPVSPVLFLYDTRNWVYKASAQLGDQFGQNMRRYMTYPALATLTAEGLMHFNSMFDEPYYFDGYPFALSFIYSEKEITNLINRHIQWLDINNVNVSTEKVDQIAFTISEHGVVVTERGWGAITDNVKSFYLWLEDSETVVGDGDGGMGTGTGPGGTNQATLDDDILEPGILV